MIFAPNKNQQVFLPKEIKSLGNRVCPIGIALLLGMLSGCCDSTKYEAESPDGKYFAKSEVTNCGATTAFLLEVSIKQARLLKFLPWRHTVLECINANRVELEWRGSDTLVITHSCRPIDIYTQEHEFRGIRIQYISLKRPDLPPGKLAPD